jgi:hypothetical protein
MNDNRASAETPAPRQFIDIWLAHDRAKQPHTCQYFREAAARTGKQQILEVSAGMLQNSLVGIAAPPPQPLLLTHGEWDQPLCLSRNLIYQQRVRRQVGPWWSPYWRSRFN